MILNEYKKNQMIKCQELRSVIKNTNKETNKKQLHLGIHLIALRPTGTFK